MPVALELDGDDPAALGQSRDEIAHQFDSHERAGQHDQRFARPVDLVVHRQPIDPGVAGVLGHSDSFRLWPVPGPITGARRLS